MRRNTERMLSLMIRRWRARRRSCRAARRLPRVRATRPVFPTVKELLEKLAVQSERDTEPWDEGARARPLHPVGDDVERDDKYPGGLQQTCLVGPASCL